MARWVDVRVEQGDLMRSLELIVAQLGPVNVQVEMHPPASGPEVEIRVQDRAHDRLVRLLESSGLSVLASRERVGPALELPEGA